MKRGRPLRCPECHALPRHLLARRKLMGEQQYLVRLNRQGQPELAPVDHIVTGYGGPLVLICEVCEHEWTTSRTIPVCAHDE
jgi:hypothetical protein